MLSIRIELPRNEAPAPDDLGGDDFGSFFAPELSPEEAFQMLLDTGHRGPGDTLVVRLPTVGVSGFSTYDLIFDLPPLLELEHGEIETADLSDGFRTRIEGELYVGLPRRRGDLDFFTAVRPPTDGGYRSFEPHDDDVAGEDRQPIVEAMDAAGQSYHDAILLVSVQTLFRSEPEASRAFADVVSAMTGYRRQHLKGEGFDGVSRSRWITRSDGFRERECDHLSAHGFGQFPEMMSLFGRAETVEDLPPVRPEDLAVLLETSPMHALALAWFDHAPIEGFTREWLVDLREEVVGPSPRRVVALEAAPEIATRAPSP